jgi:hypothetical protein
MCFLICGGLSICHVDFFNTAVSFDLFFLKFLLCFRISFFIFLFVVIWPLYGAPTKAKRIHSDDHH